MLTDDARRATSADLLDAGLVARTSAVATIREFTEPAPRGVGRVIDIRVLGGIDVEVLPDRGLDIGAAWFAGAPVSWTSPVGRAAPLDIARGMDWLHRFNGGLLTTCGTDNVGPPTDRGGLHGRHSSLPASDVRISRFRDAAATVCQVTGTLEDIEMFGRRVVVHRTIETRTDDPLVTIRDVVENQGYAATAIPLLYHVNFGAPLLMPGSRVHSGAEQLVEREPVPWLPDPLVLPEPFDAPTEAVFEHLGLPSEGGVSQVRVDSPGSDMAAVVSWSSASLPRLYQWVWPARRGWALGIEPSNAALAGPDQAGPTGGAPVVEVGGSIVTEVSVRLVDTTSTA